MKKLLLILTASIVSVVAEAQYTSDALVATNTVFTVFPTNLASANYAYSQNPGPAFPGNGLFEMKPQSQDESFAAEGGVAYQLIYNQSAATNALVPPSWGGQQTNVTATFQMLLDDYTIQKLGNMLPLGSMSNAATYTVTWQIQAGATNVGQYFQALTQGPQTNAFGAKWSKLVSLSAPGLTNGLVIQSLRAGYPQVPLPQH